MKVEMIPWYLLKARNFIELELKCILVFQKYIAPFLSDGFAGLGNLKSWIEERM
jgi:hypothetical protein